MSKQVLFVDDGDGTTLEVTPGEEAVRFTVRDFGGPGEEAAFDLSLEDVADFLRAFNEAEMGANR